MPLDQSFVGRTYPLTPPYEVCREKIREFADAVGASHPAHRDVAVARALGHRDLVAPPTFPIVLTLEAGNQFVNDPKVGVDYSRVVHGDQRFAYTRPVYAGDRLSCRVTVEELTTRGGHDFVTTRTDVETTDGEHVVATWSKLVVRGEAGDGGR
jgi:acyl dehydratase